MERHNGQPFGQNELGYCRLVWPVGSSVDIDYLYGDSLEDYASKKAHTELKALLDNSPQTAHKVVADKLIDIKVDEANIGDQLVVKPGETVPVDGKPNSRIAENNAIAMIKPNLVECFIINIPS